jgi:hypothetical protein
LQKSPILENTLPLVRKLSLLETLKSCNTFEESMHIFLENLSESPYFSEEMKNVVAEYFIMKQWNELRITLHCSNEIITTSLPTNSTLAFQSMVLKIFSKSRKIESLPTERARQLGYATIRQNTIEGLKQFALSSLENSIAFDCESRNLVANDIFDNRCDLLILPNRFDCEEICRLNHQHNENSIIENNKEHLKVFEKECPICLGSNIIDTKVPCNHHFCRSCIEEWTIAQYDCPMCRAPLSKDDFSSI